MVNVVKQDVHHSYSEIAQKTQMEMNVWMNISNNLCRSVELNPQISW